MLAKLEDGSIKYAPKKIVVDGTTIYNPTDEMLKQQGYKEVQSTIAPEVKTKTQMAVSNWVDSGEYITQEWSLKNIQPDAYEAITKMQRDAVIAQVKESDDKTMGIACSALFEVWTAGNYIAGDVRTDPDDGYPYECITPHDSVSNPGWTIKNRTLWKPWHSRSVKHALPWVQPTGAHDMYKTGEYMIWTDGTVKKCIQDTNFSPDEYKQAWEDA